MVTHVAAWTPFLTAVAYSMRGNWRVIGDGAAIALRSWKVTVQLPLVGQPTELGASLHDPGPLQYWLLAAPVHIDPVRGVLWGAALLCMIAASLAIEAAWSVLGQAGGLLVTGTILGLIAWSPGIAIKPYWNPCFGAMFFLAALAACWAVMSGRRWWWPVHVITASVAAQAHLMFAIASALLVLLALVTGLVDGFRERRRWWWAVAGLIAGLACWAAPFYQEFTGRPGNLTELFRGQGAGQRTGFIFALKSLTASIQPPPLWWPYSGQPARAARVIDGRPALVAVVLLAVVAVALIAAVRPLWSRSLARLAAISLLTSGAALLTFSHIPETGDYRNRLGYLMLVMVPAALLDLLTAGTFFVLSGQWVASRLRAAKAGRVHRGHQGPARDWIRWAGYGARAAAVLLIALAAVPGVIQQAPGFPGDARRAGLVTDAARMVEQALPAQRMTVSVVAASSRDQRRVAVGLVWALTGDGYHMGREGLAPGTPVTKVMVFLEGDQITGVTVDANRTAAAHLLGGVGPAR